MFRYCLKLMIIKRFSIPRKKPKKRKFMPNMWRDLSSWKISQIIHSWRWLTQRTQKSHLSLIVLKSSRKNLSLLSCILLLLASHFLFGKTTDGKFNIYNRCLWKREMKMLNFEFYIKLHKNNFFECENFSREILYVTPLMSLPHVGEFEDNFSRKYNTSYNFDSFIIFLTRLCHRNCIAWSKNPNSLN